MATWQMYFPFLTCEVSVVTWRLTFTTSVYDIWMPTHLERIRSAIDALPPNLEQSEPGGSGLSQGLESHSLAD
jgi:hypothetical protein